MSLGRVCTNFLKVSKQKVEVTIIREYYRFRGNLSLRQPQSDKIENPDLEEHRISKLNYERVEPEEEIPTEAPRDYKYIYPDFLPQPTWHRRDKLLEKLTRQEMFRRRTKLDIPEFYIGSILAVTIADETSPNKQNRFVGICIERYNHTLRHSFILRNAIDGEGVEIIYELYNPLIQKIEVLKLEKRLDDKLTYLRDCPPEYSHVPFDFEAVPLPKGMAVPVNPIKVPLNKPPWHERWERMELKGVTGNTRKLTAKQRKRAELSKKPWEKYDLMLQYRQNINAVEEDHIYREVHEVYSRKQENKNSDDFMDQFWKKGFKKKSS